MDLRTLSDKLWDGTIITADYHPLYWRADGPEEVADSLLVCKFGASANVIDTGDGLVMLDTGARSDTDALYAGVRRWRPELPLRAAVFLHHHADHVFGVAPFDREANERGWPGPTVYGYEFVGVNFDRYSRTPGWNAAINTRQFRPGNEPPLRACAVLT